MLPLPSVAPQLQPPLALSMFTHPSDPSSKSRLHQTPWSLRPDQVQSEAIMNPLIFFNDDFSFVILYDVII